jgi:hypothetical protein
MKRIGFLLLMTGLFLCACKKEQPNPPSTNKPVSSGNPLTAPVDYLGAVAQAKKTAEKTVDTAALNQAIQLFYAQEGRYPKNLNELIGPDYLSKLPQPPPGMKFDYNPTTGQLKVVPQ